MNFKWKVIIMLTPPKFSEIEYRRPDFEAVQKSYNQLAEEAKAAPDYASLRQVIDRWNTLRGEMNFQCEIAFIRCYLDSSDAFYTQEMQSCQQSAALLDDSALLTAILETPFASQLDADLGENYRRLLGDNLKLTAKGKELQAQCAQLESEYQKLKATLRISFDGKELSEGQMTPYLQSTDRNVRRAASIALQSTYVEKKAEFTELLNKLVETRVAVAKANGFDNYMDYANLGMGRRSFGEKELMSFCKQVRDDLVPLMEKLDKLQAQRLGLDKLASYDSPLTFPDGNAKPVGDGPALLELGKKMYDDMGEEISSLYRAMADNGYIDVTSSPNKISGMGFCTVLTPLKFPYIFGNCDGSINDATVLTHEMGHSYQMRLCVESQPVDEYLNMPNDVVEIPSKTMEQFTSPYAELFFGKDAEKFRFDHMQHVVSEICSFCATHEFEDWLYGNPSASAEQRVERFNEIFMEYNPGVDFSEIAPYASQGSQLFRNMGVFMFPAYVISYALSDMGALAFRERAQADFPSAWEDYRALCAAGGTLDYDGLMKTAKLQTAYTPGTVKRAAKTAAEALGVEY